MSDKNMLVTPENIQGELIKTKIELNNLQFQAFKEQKYNELLKENKQLKEVIEEVREWLKYKAEALDEFDIPKRKETGAFWFSTRGEIDNLLQILDKAKGE